MEESAVDQYLQARGLTRYKVTQVSGIRSSTLNKAQKNPINAMTVKTIQALCMATGDSPGETLDALLKLEGNPVIGFIQAHPYLDKKLVTEVEDLLIDAHEAGIKLTTTTFNRYHNEGLDTNERAEKALTNFKNLLIEKIKDCK